MVSEINTPCTIFSRSVQYQKLDCQKLTHFEDYSMWGAFSKKSMDFIDTPISQHARINILEGSVRSSKTWTMIPVWLNYIRSGPPGLLGMAGKSKTTLYDNVLRDMFSTVGSGNYRYNRQYGDLKICGREIKIIAAKDIGSEDYIRGLTLAGFYGDEASLYPKNVFSQILNRTSVENSKLFFTTNPDSPYHYLYTDYISDAYKISSGMVRTIHFDLDDNPNLSDEYKNFIRAAHSGLWYRRMILGQWVIAEGAIYDMYDPKKHEITREQLPKQFAKRLIGIDYSAGNPTAFLKIGVNFVEEKPEFWEYDEYYHDSAKTGFRTNAQYKADLIKFIGGEKIDLIAVDPSALSFITELRSNSCGGTFRNVRGANNDVLSGINTVATAMSIGRYHVVASACPNSCKETVSYLWDPVAQKRGEDSPIKEHDHCKDAERYALHTAYPASNLERLFLTCR